MGVAKCQHRPFLFVLYPLCLVSARNYNNDAVRVPDFFPLPRRRGKAAPRARGAEDRRGREICGIVLGGVGAAGTEAVEAAAGVGAAGPEDAAVGLGVDDSVRDRARDT